MLAEQVSFTKDQLPKELHDKAIVLAGEFSWSVQDALDVVNWLEAHGREVVGVELWRQKEGQPLFMGTSGYSPRQADSVTSDSIAMCAHHARAFIHRFNHEPEALFNIVWA